MTGYRGSGHSAPFVGSDLAEEDFDRIRQLLLARRGFDLGMYKDQCIRRRIAARIRACGLARAADYIARLTAQDEEIDALLAAISIHVSQFFRNPQIFARLEADVLPQLARQALQRADRTLRLWCAGCAGGEEAYSLALLMDELAPQGLTVEVLGTDISPQVLDRARAGEYGLHRLSEVPPEVLERYFDRDGLRYRLCERIRRQVRFELHNLLDEGPYPAADLVLCRNVMIYFSRIDQQRILRRMAAALAPEGILVLGSAETIIGEPRQWFEPLFATERIYRCRLSP
ncbi:CheR-type MCP methyltransferase [Geothermobacter ehrlichii]|uniref:protein-glutamate O-methyltransferase n=1 Tax=Geothermobacter ehrlichii TaxID=213224 RepID=A0A5D3WH45_9BACT|nr:protein-glutamate O-methyltransferase CheR [Geothermobacter ehrlichii]TYO98146.1 CheR-type MCP methyltransferase [Geothermobacter ehrlichii]